MSDTTMNLSAENLNLFITFIELDYDDDDGDD